MQKCDICGSSKNIKTVMFVKGEDQEIDRMYNFCYDHLIEVYAKVVDDFAENNEHKVNSYLKSIADRLIMDALNDKKVNKLTDENGDIDPSKVDIFEVRSIPTYLEDE